MRVRIKGTGSSKEELKKTRWKSYVDNERNSTICCNKRVSMITCEAMWIVHNNSSHFVFTVDSIPKKFSRSRSLTMSSSNYG